MQDAPLAGQGPAGTAARASTGPRSRGCLTASWRISSPLRATRSLNVAVLAAIPTLGQVFQFSLSDTTRHLCSQFAAWTPRASRLLPQTIARTSDLQQACAARLLPHMRFAIGTVQHQTVRCSLMMQDKKWARLLAYITPLVNQQLLLQYSSRGAVTHAARCMDHLTLSAMNPANGFGHRIWRRDVPGQLRRHAGRPTRLRLSETYGAGGRCVA